MFDSNMRHLPKGMIFFAEIHSIVSGSKLYDLGYTVGDVILCKMISKGHDNPAILVDGVQITSNESWFITVVYSGNSDGSGFIDDMSKEKALRIAGGQWIAKTYQ